MRVAAGFVAGATGILVFIFVMAGSDQAQASAFFGVLFGLSICTAFGFDWHGGSA